ncbi:MAG: DUF445 domain-containing protein [Acidimicrobiales bacterium]
MERTPALDVPMDRTRRADLRRMKLIAGGLLVAAAVVFALTFAADDDGGWVGYVRAFAEAAMVGALADWFAVTALFRHPLGLPIPHTAIIQTRKDQIGATLGGFVRDNFLTSEIITERLEAAHLARRVGGWLSVPANAATVSAQSAAVVRGVTEVLQDDVVQSGIEQTLTRRIRELPVAPLMGQVVDAAIVGDHHQVLLESTLRGLSRFVEENQAGFRERLNQESPWWVPEPIDDVVFDKIYTAVQAFLSDLAADRNHPMRLDVDARAARLAQELRDSPEMQAKGEALIEEVLSHPEVRAWSATLWSRIKQGLIEATENPDSELRTRLEAGLVDAGRAISSDPALQARVDHWIIDATAYVAEQFRSEVADLIATTVQRWDTEETSERIELQVGRDLQFIRINGTVVGGLAGLVIHAVSELLF